MSTFDLHDLANRWYAQMVGNMHLLSMGTKIELEDYGLGGDTPFDAVAAMDQVLSTNPSLSQEITETLGPTAEGVCHTFLLMWLQTQEKPGRKTLDMDRIVRTWPEKDILRDKDSYDTSELDFRKAQAIVYCAHAVASQMTYEQSVTFFTPLVDLFARTFRPCNYRYSIQEFADFYVHLGHCALKSVGYPKLFGCHHEQTWTNNLGKAMPSDHGAVAVMMNTIATSDLPKDFKRGALAHLSPGNWCHPEVYPNLLPLLPSEENRRIPFLPWNDIPIYLATMNTAAAYSTNAMEKNKALVLLYCPFFDS